MTVSRGGLLSAAFSIVLSGAIVYGLAGLVPDRLVAATDLIGNPTYRDFDIHHYQKIALLIGLGWPALAIAGWLLLTRVLMRRVAGGSSWWRKAAFESPELPEMRPVEGAVEGAAGARAEGAFGKIAGKLVWLAPLGPFALWAASARTEAVIIETGAAVAWPWFPLWLAAVLAVAGWAVLGAVRAARPVAMLWLGVPIVWLSMATLPGALGRMDLFHEGELLAATWMAWNGAVPWADMHLIHGPWYDVGRGLVGFWMFEPSRWGAAAGQWIILQPLQLCLYFVLFGWLFRWRWLPVVLATLVVACLDPFGGLRLMLYPPLLLATGLLIERAGWLRAFAVVGLGAALGFSVPEAAFAPIAVGLIILLRDSLDAGAGDLKTRFRRTLMCLVLTVPTAAVVIGGFQAFGMLDGLLHHITVLPRDHSLAGGIPIASQIPGGSVLGVGGLIMAALGLVLAFVCAGIQAKRPMRSADWVVLAAAVFVALYAQKAVNRADGHIYHVMAAALPVMGVVLVRLVLLVEGAVRARLHSARLKALRPVMVFSLLAAAFFGPSWLEATKSEMAPRWQFGVPALSPVTALDRLRSNVLALPEIERLGYARADAVDPALIVGWRDMLRIHAPEKAAVLDLTNRPGLFHALLDRPTIGGFYHVSMALRTESQDELIQDLQRAKPAVVIMPTRPGWDGIPDTVRHYAISRAVLQDYVPVASRPDGLVLVPREEDRANDRKNGALYLDAVACDWGYAGGFLKPRKATAEPLVEPWPLGVFPPQGVLTITGWAADRVSGQPARRLFATLDGAVLAEVRPNIDRPDVAAALGAESALKSGFQLAMLIDPDRADDVVVTVEATDGSVSPLNTGPESVVDAGGAVDTRELIVRTGIRHLETLPGGRVWGDVGLVVRGGAPGKIYRISDTPPWSPAAARRSIRFGSPRGGEVRIPLGACPQWWALDRGEKLFLWAEDGETPADLTIERSVAK